MATAETVMAVYSPDGVRGQGTGKPDETERLTSGLERGRRKSTERQLADVLLYRTYGSVRGNRGNSVPYRHRQMQLSKIALVAGCHFNFAHPVTFQPCADNRPG